MPQSLPSLASVAAITLDAGAKTLDIYGQDDFGVELKDDESPLTLADQASHEVIESGLKALTPDIPILSEEGADIPYEDRKAWGVFWLVDPLDGTKEFIKRNGEFTINIALVKNGVPVLGAVYAPVLDTLYVAKEDFGSYKVEDVSKKEKLTDENLESAGQKLPSGSTHQTTVIASRSHMSDETQAFIDELKAKHGDVDIQSAGSSLKLCLVAEGQADYYPRYAPTMEWDTGAGHAIVIHAGGKVTNHETQTDLVYNKENLKNPWFLVEAASK